ncbi:hypothetical protein LTR66_016653, partial [Elasticomyces elasticus]
MNATPATPVEKEKFRRTSHSKVRTGCQTCRYDFQFSHLDISNATKGDPCVSYVARGDYLATIVKSLTSELEYFVPAKSLPFTFPIDPHPNPTNQAHASWQTKWTSPGERYFLDFFRERTSLHCAGYFYDEFWERLVHQATEDYPAIRHAVIAMGCLNYHFSQSGPSSVRLVSSQITLLDPFSLQQSNKSITLLQQTLSKGHTSRLEVEGALIACVVLVSTILFQEDSALAGRHLLSGYMLLDQYLRNHGNTSLLAATITKAFAGIHLMWSLFISTSSQPQEPLAILPLETNSGSGNAIQKANDLMVTMLRISALQSWFKGFDLGPSVPELDIDPALFFSKIQPIPGQIQAYRAAQGQQMPMIQLPTRLTILDLWAEILALVTSAESRTEPRNMVYDHYMEQFERSLQLASELMIHDHLAPTFSVRVGVTAPLFFIILKSRDRATRCKLIALLRRWRRQEGMGAIDFIDLLTERALEVESMDFGPGDLIAESSRVKSIRIDPIPAKFQ